MINKIIEYVKKCELLTINNKVVVGVSGGADSICLLLVLLEMREIFGLEIIPVHINHNLRGRESYRDQKFVLETCEQYGLELKVESVDLLEYKKKLKLSEEEAGRILRRSIFERISDEYGGASIALGHHRDDNVETCLMNMARGTGLEGLSGISAKAGRYIRPLLCVHRVEIEEYLEGKGQCYCTDSTNLEDAYTRNKVRNHIIPAMHQKINEKSSENISNLLDDIGELKEFVDVQVKMQVRNVVKTEGDGVTIIGQKLNECHTFIQREIVKGALVSVSRSYKNIGRVHIRLIIELLDMQVGREIHLPYGLVATRVYEGIVIKKKVDEVNEVEFKRIPLQINGQTVVNEKMVIVTTLEEYNGLENVVDNHYTKYYDYDIIGDKLFVDRIDMEMHITINKQGGRQSLKKFCKNQKIAKDLRSEVLNIRTESQVLWIINYRSTLEAKVTEQTKKIIKIQIGGQEHGRKN